ncbi:hypothetical protein Enr8_18180 [Blastopirellula retiformator]|uniref:Carboxypeptidase regulatory-like domain-containing protein n=2 Tax=Blastopirellula retiformator TaxID=2527970 RepID=A0A5C5V8R1_9BACT|nr:hypothetical protein Enr8_18180 [Blastopirellula retiformator]
MYFKQQRSSSWQVRSTLLLSALVLAVGCSRGSGENLGFVSGTVTLDGQPLSQVMVTFSPDAGGRESYGVTNAAGQYQLRYTSQDKGAKLGQHQVRISPVGVEPREPIAVEATSPVPTQYYGEDFLLYEVNPGANEIDLQLTKAPLTTSS